jgi:Helix-turn-helix domain
MNRNATFPGTNAHARSRGDQTVTITKSAIEAKLRRAVGDAAFDAIPNAAPRKAVGASGARGGCGGPGAVKRSPRSPARRPRRYREKVFGDGRPLPLDRNAKVRIMTLAKALMRPTEKGKHWGAITAKAFEVLKALLWAFHNVVTGKCFPSYEKIAEAAGCHRSTVAEAIKMLEAAGLLTWVNRLTRIWEPVLDMFGQWTTRRRMIRTSNGYRFIDPHPSSKSEFPSVTSSQDIPQEPLLFNDTPKIQPRNATSSLENTLAIFGRLVKQE